MPSALRFSPDVSLRLISPGGELWEWGDTVAADSLNSSDTVSAGDGSEPGQSTNSTS